MINNLILPKALLVPASPVRVVLHWTAGGPIASIEDKVHYHLIVERDGRLVLGYKTIADNDDTRDGHYAAHTRMLNTKSIGVALAGMDGSVERPFNPGPTPITHSQYEIGCRAIAELCHHYHIDVTEHTVLNHGEVETKLDVPQRGKWDVMVFPWAPAMSWEQVGEKFRSRVNYYLEEIERTLSGDTEKKAEKKALVTAKSGLRMRAGPAIGFPTIAVANYGDIVPVLTGPKDGWVEVSCNNSTGYMAAKYLEFSVEGPKG